MAKRKRLSPAQSGYLSGAPESKSALAGPLAAPAQTTAPIAQVASEASSHAALQELSEVLQTARAKGLMIEEIPLDAIDETHLVRDRITQDEDEMAALIASIRSRGQQTPIEVVPLEGRLDGKAWGLISGWRRLSALRRLYTETSESDFAKIKALVIRPESAEAAYVAMVEENEIRVNLSHYERARIAVRALKEGVYPTQKKALQGLFANAPRAKRSKIGSFVSLVEALDAVLYFPTAISEKLGLALVRQMAEDTAFASTLKTALQDADRQTSLEELAILNQVLDEHQNLIEQRLPKSLEPIQKPESVSETGVSHPRIHSLPQAEPQIGERISTQVMAGLRLGYRPDKQCIELSGAAVDDVLLADLTLWLKSR